jgi:hypothetical protein
MPNMILDTVLVVFIFVSFVCSTSFVIRCGTNPRFGFRLLEWRDLKLLVHAFGGHATGAFCRAAGEVLRTATAAFVEGNGELGFAITGGGPFGAAPSAKVLLNARGRLAHESPGARPL